MHLSTLFQKKTIEKVLDRSVSYDKYQGDPVGFGEDVLGETYTDDIKKLMESVRDNVVTVAQSANATGKTHGAARIAVWFFKCFDGSQVYTAAAPPEENLKKLLWGEIGSITTRLPRLFSEFKSNVLLLKRSALSFLAGVAIPVSGDAAIKQAKFSGKHAPHLLFILDEGDAIPDEIYKGIESCMSGGHVRLLIMFNPRAEAGPVYRMIRDRTAHVVELSALTHPNVVTGDDIIPGAVDRETTVRRVNQWCRKIKEGETVDASSSFDLPEYLEGVVAKSQNGMPYPPLEPGKYKITDPAFSHMVLGRYPAQGVDQLISKEWTAAARARWDLYVTKFGEVPPKGSTAIMGIDPAEMGNDLTKVCFRYGGYVAPLIEWGGVDMNTTGERATVEYHKRDVRVAIVDGNGVGSGVAPLMANLTNRCHAHGIKAHERATERAEIGEFHLLRDECLWKMREWLKTDPGSMLPPDELLLEELHVLNYWIDRGRINVMTNKTIKELLNRSGDAISALFLTFAKVDPKTIPFVHKKRKKKRYAW